MAKLTQTVVSALKPSKVGVKGSYSFTWDGELRGFGVQVQASGLKSFVLQYRTDAGRSRRIVIGRYGVMTVEEARREARSLLGRIARGDDPAEKKAVDLTTVADVCDWYLCEADAGRLLGRRRRPIKASTLAMDRSRIETHVKPLLGRRPVASLKLGDIEAAQADIAAGKTAKPRKGPRGGAASGGEGVAARTMSTLHSVFEHALRLGRIETNPAKGVRKLACPPRDRRLSRLELARLSKALTAAVEAGENPTGLATIRFLLLTGFRRMEALGLQRSWLDEDAGVVRFPDTKSGAQVRVLGRAAVDLVLARPSSASPYVFPADCGDGHFIGAPRVLERVCAAARLEGVTAHTLRHTFASEAAKLGFSELTIAALLGHVSRGVTQRYIHIDEALRLAADRTAAAMAAHLDGAELRPAHKARGDVSSHPARAKGATHAA